MLSEDKTAHYKDTKIHKVIIAVIIFFFIIIHGNCILARTLREVCRSFTA